MDLINGLLFIGFFAYIARFGITLTGVYLTSFFTNVITSIFSIAFEASKPQLVYKDKLQTINALSQIIHAGTAIVGPILGGMAYAFLDIKLFILFNGLSFVISGLSELFINFKFNAKKSVESKILHMREVIQSLKEGYLYILDQKAIMSFYGMFIAINILMSLAIQVPLPYILNEYIGINPKLYGVVFSCLPFGMIFGAIVVGPVLKRVPMDYLFSKISIVSGFLVIMIGLPFFLPALVEKTTYIVMFYGSCMLTFGVILSLIDIPFATFIQKNVDQQYLGRVWGILIPMIKIVNPIGFLLSGFLLENINPYLIPIFSGVIFLIFSLYKKKSFARQTRLEAAS